MLVTEVSVVPIEHTSGLDTLVVTVELESLAAVVSWRVLPRTSEGWRVGFCRTGDPHGENVRDWIHHIAAHLGVSETDYWRALATSPCVGVADNTYPFTGGYRAD